MDGRRSVEDLLDTERRLLETIRHDETEVDERALCKVRISIYHRVLKQREIANFKSDKDVDDFRSEVDEIAHEMKTSSERFEKAIDGLIMCRIANTMESGAST